MSDAVIVVTPNYFLFNDMKVYQLRLQGVDNSAVGYLYCQNNQTYSRASNMNKLQIKGLCQVKKAIAQRREVVTDIAPLLTTHGWLAYPIDGEELTLN